MPSQQDSAGKLLPDLSAILASDGHNKPVISAGWPPADSISAGNPCMNVSAGVGGIPGTIGIARHLISLMMQNRVRGIFGGLTKNMSEVSEDRLTASLIPSILA
ncbi:MAG: hypothetical protein RLZZ458_95 [Planctomycetota bacterium]|jgi:hypothetical protein